MESLDWKKKYADQIEKTVMPDFMFPMLATLTDEYFDHPDWIYERKLDGERVLAFKKGNDIRLMSRNEKRLNHSYPEIVDALNKYQGDFVIDGEIVAFTGGKTDFQKLQERMHIQDIKQARQSSVEVFFYIFDVLYSEGYDLRQLQLLDRKKILKENLSFSSPLNLISYIDKDGLRYYEKACDAGWEGIIAKDKQSKYENKRSKKWLKFKCVNKQEFVIGGYTDPQGGRVGFGAILIGYWEEGKLCYAGKVGTGWDEESLSILYKEMKKLKQEESPFDEDIEAEDDVHFIKPELVCEIGFSEWTRTGKLRHPRFLGLRRDKDPSKVRKEGE